ncbi:hypothetical protein LOTGIDRAFT_141723 [Lottia gigantea]|uniref:Glutathione transferase n=1 Tax=Lottia gigantea TaxID=225164 RepID=V4CCR4_LOTGI|nr:hypothetical protein LOTGIDRAFT_141723 [Lottia gigantea]ESO99694.1 hypothetical protein LOTGIDRAFT_141723 [Lottia gigantea]
MSDEAEWELYYHDTKLAGVGRNEFAKLIFEEVGVKYKEVNDNMYELFRGDKWTGYPTFAPPMIKKGDFSLSQAGVISRYLGKQFGLYPDNEVDQWHAEQLSATVHDYLAEAYNPDSINFFTGRLAFHGVYPTDSYFSQQEGTQPYINRFVEKRFHQFLKHFEKALTYNNRGFMVGNKLTYIDLEVYHILRATENQFPEAWRDLSTIPHLKAFKNRIEVRPNIATYLKSTRCNKFQGNSMM